ncbi:hypothetical protein BGZ98_003383, partial [Dissophora globulifera]
MAQTENSGFRICQPMMKDESQSSSTCLAQRRIDFKHTGRGVQDGKKAAEDCSHFYP